jgi:predicted ATPase/DNA-binding SARP family transcriptional activator
MQRPVYLSSFVGRKSELDEIRARLQERSIRLLTLIGPGGSGKTRLANEAVSAFTDEYEDGIAWVDLVGVSLPSAVAQTAASSLNINLPADQSPIDALANALCAREMLIVIDNCEHVASACSELLDGILRECSSISILATSRIPLGIQGEHTWLVPPMAHPGFEQTEQPLSEFDAVMLFAERAQQVNPDFRITEQDRQALVQILSLLDGQPLAIELAAARLNALNLPQMVNRLEDQLSFLTDHTVKAEGRHRSMEAAIRWSYTLLSEEAAMLFRRLGVFVGSFSLDAAEKICSLRSIDESRVFDLIDALIRHSMVTLVDSQQDQTRYRLLEAVRQFALSELDKTDEADSLHNRHQRYYAALAVDAEAHMLGPEQHRWTARLQRDYPNFQKALQWLFEKCEDDTDVHQSAAEMVASLFWPWNYTERYEEAIGWYARALALDGLDHQTSLYADLTRYQATCIWLSGDFIEAKKKLELSMHTSEEIGYHYCAAHARLLIGIIELHEKQIEQAIDKILKSEAAFKELGEARELSIARTNLGGAFMELGDLERGREYAELAVAGARASQDPWAQGLSLQILGSILHRQGDAQGALPLMREALELLEIVGQGWLQAETLWRQAVILREIGKHENAIQQLERCFELSEEIGAVEWQLSALRSMGFIALEQERVQQAIGYFTQVFRLTEGEEYRHIQVRALLGVAEIAARAGKWGWSVQLWNDYRAMCSRFGLPASSEETRLQRLLKVEFDGAIPADRSEVEGLRSLPQVADEALECLYRLEFHAPEQATTYELQLLGLGPIDVFLDGKQLVASDWTFAKPKELLFYLASNPPKTKEEIGLAFWPDASPDQLRAGLRAALYHLRNALGKREWILYEDGYYRFNRDMSYYYDVEQFERQVQLGHDQVASDPGQAIDVLEHAVSLYRGDFVADLADDEWAAIRREELRRAYQEAAILLSELLIEAGDYHRSEAHLRNLLDADPLLEQAHRGLMRCYAGLGEQGLAKKQFEEVVELLQAELGVEPSVETTDLYQSLLSNVN